MLDLARLHRISLSARPRIQRIIGTAFLAPQYHAYPGVEIVLEGLENLPDGPVIFAMNHTDRYNYWPFQFQLWQARGRFTATWVKGKYYENELLGWFMELNNSVPTVSKGYLIAKDFHTVMQRNPSNEEYMALRDLVNGARGVDEVKDEVPAAILRDERLVLGRVFMPSREDYGEGMRDLYRLMMQRFVALNQEAIRKNLDVIIFPEGTRSVRLSKGHIGLSQLALKFGQTIVPVGCNGCDLVYPGSSPVARAGRIVYRLGKPITPQEQDPYRPEKDFVPFDPVDEALYKDSFQGLVDVVMDRINGLLDVRHQYAEGKHSDGVKGNRRFL